jgi:hypothetical protein
MVAIRPMVPSVDAFSPFSFSAERAAPLKLSSPTAVTARATFLQREETHRALTQAVVELLEGITVDEGSYLVERLGMVGGVACARGIAMLSSWFTKPWPCSFHTIPTWPASCSERGGP